MFYKISDQDSSQLSKSSKARKVNIKGSKEKDRTVMTAKFIMVSERDLRT